MPTALSANGSVAVSRPRPPARVAVIRSLSDRLVVAQRPLRILEAVKWDPSVERAFFASGCRRLPPVTRDYYTSRPLPFDPGPKREEFRLLERDVRRRLGVRHPAGRILARMCGEYRRVIDLLENRGTRAFGTISADLYGTAGERVLPGEPPLLDLGRRLAGLFDHLPSDTPGGEGPALDAATAVVFLAARLAEYFGASVVVRVRRCDGLLADASAGGDSIKLRGDASFTARDLRLLEVHEGWVHLGTTLNGQCQPVCGFLAKGSPSATVTQEGLAVLTEFLAGASHPGRVRRLVRRIEAVALAEAGADFLDVYRYFLAEGCPPSEGYRYAMRTFRGGLPSGGGPFTKDLSYAKGFLLLCRFLRHAADRGEAHLAPLLFCGKTGLDDLPALAQLRDVGLLEPPRHLPPPFADPHVLGARLRLMHVGPGLTLQGERGFLG